MHELKLTVRLSETDALGIVYYANYLVYFDIARIELLKEAKITFKELKRLGYQFLCAEVNCRYLAPINLDEHISIFTWIEKIGRTSINYRHKILKEDGRIAAHGYVRDVLVDNHGNPVLIPEEWKTSLRKYMSES
ncbi:MAG TPA: acyl-CoA thioesterase [Geobacterales bacterium]|nr:acyl-CoA thioesterase [Geobacterales bacterium]